VDDPYSAETGIAPGRKWLMGPGQRKWMTICLTAYAVVLFTAMTLYRLPAQKLIQEGLLQLTDGQVAITAERISPSFPLGYRLENVEYSTVLGGEFSKDRVKLLRIFPEYSNLVMGYFPVVIKGDMPRGSFELRTGVSMRRGSKDSYVSLRTSEAYLEDFNVLRLFSGRGLKGKIRAEVSLRGNIQDLKINGDGHLLVEEGALESHLDQLGINDIPFKKMNIPFSVREGLISVRESEMAGPLFSGTFSGEIKLTKPLARTLLKLTARMKPGPGLAGSEQAGRFMAALGAGGEPLVIKLGGTLQQPFVSWGN
jgi:type II secretion system protein N